MSEVITKALKDLRARQKELAPLAEEFREIEAAIAALEPTNGSTARQPRRTRPPKSTTGRARRGRPRKGEPTRADEFLALVREQPGISTSDAAQRMSVAPAYLYRVSAKLEEEGKIASDGQRGFVPTT